MHIYFRNIWRTYTRTMAYNRASNEFGQKAINESKIDVQLVAGSLTWPRSAACSVSRDQPRTGVMLCCGIQLGDDRGMSLCVTIRSSCWRWRWWQCTASRHRLRFDHDAGQIMVRIVRVVMMIADGCKLLLLKLLVLLRKLLMLWWTATDRTSIRQLISGSSRPIGWER